MRLAEMRTRALWDRTRASAVAPVGLIVAVAIVCIVIAGVTSAQRADDVAIRHEQQLFVNAMAEHRERVLRETESVATTEDALRHIRGDDIDTAWVHRHVANTLRTYFAHDYVFVVDPADRLVYPVQRPGTPDAKWFDEVRPDLERVLGPVRGRDSNVQSGADREQATQLSWKPGASGACNCS